MENNKLKISKKMIALLAAGGIAFAPIESLANTKYTEGTFVREVEVDETSEYGEYVVMEGDNLSKISEKICGHYKQEVSTKYWPALAFLNDYPRVINPGDIIIYPKSFDRLVEINNKLREIGWTAKYIYNNKVYGPNKKEITLTKKEIRILLEGMYGDNVCVDDDFIRTYIQMHKSGSLVEWIPTIEEIEKFREDHADKTKRK